MWRGATHNASISAPLLWTPVKKEDQNIFKILINFKLKKTSIKIIPYLTGMNQKYKHGHQQYRRLLEAYFFQCLNLGSKF